MVVTAVPFAVPKANDVFSDFQYVAPVWTVLSSPELHPPVNKVT